VNASCMPGERPMDAFRSLFSGLGGFFQRLEISDMDLLSVDVDFRSIASAFDPEYPFEPGFIVGAHTRIGPVFDFGRRPEVFRSIIGFISVDMVDFDGNWMPTGEKPDQAVRPVVFVVDTDTDITAAIDRPGSSSGEKNTPPDEHGLCPEMFFWPASPGKNACFRVVVQYLADIVDIGQCPDSHEALSEGCRGQGCAGAVTTAHPVRELNEMSGKIKP